MSRDARAESAIDVRNLQEFFRDAVHDALARQQAGVDDHTEHYVVNMLTMFSRSEALFDQTREGPGLKPLALMLADAASAALVVIVHNDCGWGMTRDMQSEFYGKERQIGNQLGLVRYDRIVEALGGHGEFVERPEDFTPALQRALQAGKPALVNTLVDPRPKSPGLMTFMMMEVMLGKETYFDRIPDWIRKLGAIGLDGLTARVMRGVIDRNLHQEIK